MVLNRDVKEDVFAGFNIDKGVDDNEDRLKRMLEEERKRPSQQISGSAFTEFELEEIIKKHEDRLHMEETERKAKAAAQEEEWADSDSIRSSSRAIASAPVRQIASSLRGIGLLRRPPPLMQRAVSEGAGRRNPRGNVDLDKKHVFGQEIEYKGYIKREKTKRGIASRSGTTITTTVREEDDEDYESEEDEIISISDDDVEKGDVADDSDGDDSLIENRKREKRSMLDVVPQDVITRSSTGMPIGGMLTSGKKHAKSTQPSEYSWVSPHSADTIFNDFDIDAIAKDYERMRRKTNYAAAEDLDDIEEEDNNPHVMGITKRYRNLRTFWLENFPRTHGIIFRIMVPLWLIIGATWFLGGELAKLEKGEEIASNNAIIRAQHNLTGFPTESLFFITDGPTACFNQYLDQKLQWNRNNENKTLLSGLDLPVVTPMMNFSDPESTMDELNSYMQVCKDTANTALQHFIDYKQLELEAATQGSLTFNWIRCWNTTIYGDVNPMYPDKAQLSAAVNQSQFYYDSWKSNQTALYYEYLLEKNITDTSYFDKDAFDRSVEDATGETMCGCNKAASAWFWFVFMTTVGYGNVSPVTQGGRVLVASIGWLTVIVWAIVLYIAGRVLGIIIEDLFRRWNCRRLTGNFGSVMIWGTVATGWIVFIAEQYMYWYNKTEHPEKFRFSLFGINDEFLDGSADIMTPADAYWFSYISLLTVGLGDFSIGTESFFLTDLLGWTMSFLTGFTLLSTFLGQIADLTNNIFPDSGNHLKERLLNTNVVGKKEVQYKRENEKGIERLEKLVEIMDDDDQELITQRVTRIRVKKNLLVHLLHQTKIELDYYKKRGEKYESLSYARTVLEENMLHEVLQDTRKERAKLEAYRSHGSSEGSALPAPGSEQSYFDDGTPLDEVEAKLKVRKGEKSARKKLKASWYI